MEPPVISSSKLRWTLAIETSTLTLSVALLDGRELVDERVVHTPRGHAMIVLPEVSALLEAHGIQVNDLHLVVMSLGPGSFTGIRIGMATARALVWSTSAYGVGVCSMEVLACGVPGPERLVATVLDARKGEVFGALYRVHGVEADPDILLDPIVAPPDVFAAAVREQGESEILCIGPGLQTYPDMVQAMGAQPGESDWDVVRASVAARLGRRRFLSEGGTDWSAIQPIYLRRSDAEINVGPPTGQATIEHR